MDKHTKPFIHARPAISLLIAAMFSTGCATMPPPSANPPPLPVQPASQAASLPLTFAQAGLRDRLASLKLLEPLTAYWAAHTARDWNARYDMEQFAASVQRDFYVAYHGSAWNIKKFEIIQVHEADKQGRVRVDIDAVFSDGSKTADQAPVTVQDWWLPVEDGKWRHINTDPMLNAFKKVL